MNFHPRSLILFCTVLLVPVACLHAVPNKQGEALIGLLNLFTSRTDPLAVANAGILLTKGASPLAAFEADPHAPLSSLLRWNSPETTRSLARQLGEYVVEHSNEFASALPDPSPIQEPLRLEAFFEGMCQPTLGASMSAEYSQRDLARLSVLLDDSWLDAAAACGALNIQQLLVAHRGNLTHLLRSYQESNDEVSLIILGETLASYSDAYRQIEPHDFQLRTLALLLSGTLGVPQFDPDENLTIVTIVTKWALVHPRLIDILRNLRDPASLSLMEASLLWAKDREKSIRTLASTHWVSTVTRARFAMELIQTSTLSESEAIPLIRLLPSEILARCLKVPRSGKIIANPKKLNEWIGAELGSRTDKWKSPK
jgi:hypothetical protein